MTDERHTYEFDVAVSFAGEDRTYVNEVVAQLKDELRIFYDEDFAVETWGEDLVEYFSTLYMARTRFVVMFVSTHYAEKDWTRVERRAALASAMIKRGAYVLPIRLDDTQLPALLPSMGFLDARRMGIESIVNAIRSKVAGPDSTPVPPRNTPVIPATQADVERVISERPLAWEYRLFAGLMVLSLRELESDYFDFKMAYARPNGILIQTEELAGFCSQQLSMLTVITNSLEGVLEPSVQARAFGEPGEPGDAERITHLARRLISGYADLLAWSSSIRATASTNDADGLVLRLLAEWTAQPVESYRSFVESFAEQVSRAPAAIEAGERVEIRIELKFELPDGMQDAYQAAIRAALSGQ